MTKDKWQEPVVWMPKIDQLEGVHKMTDGIPLYMHPYQWQGLTDDEINEVCLEMFETPAAQGDLKFGYAIEQALKDKNTP